MVILAPAAPLNVALMWFTLLVAAVTAYVMRHEIRDSLREVFEGVPPARVRLAVATFVALCLAVVMGTAVEAYPAKNWCDWGNILEACGGYEACAWAVWLANGCPFLPV